MGHVREEDLLLLHRLVGGLLGNPELVERRPEVVRALADPAIQLHPLLEQLPLARRNLVNHALEGPCQLTPLVGARGERA